MTSLSLVRSNYLLGVLPSSSEKSRRFNTVVADLLFMPVDDGDAVLGLDGVVCFLFGLTLFLATTFAIFRDLKN